MDIPVTCWVLAYFLWTMFVGLDPNLAKVTARPWLVPYIPRWRQKGRSSLVRSDRFPCDFVIDLSACYVAPHDKAHLPPTPYALPRSPEYRLLYFHSSGKTKDFPVVPTASDECGAPSGVIHLEHESLETGESEREVMTRVTVHE